MLNFTYCSHWLGVTMICTTLLIAAISNHNKATVHHLRVFKTGHIFASNAGQIFLTNV